MKIIIVGAGKTGTVLTRSLTNEGHDVTIIDYNADRITNICNDDDVMSLVGNGVNYSTLSEAGIAEADLLM